MGSVAPIVLMKYYFIKMHANKHNNIKVTALWTRELRTANRMMNVMFECVKYRIFSCLTKSLHVSQHSSSDNCVVPRYAECRTSCKWIIVIAIEKHRSSQSSPTNRVRAAIIYCMFVVFAFGRCKMYHASLEFATRNPQLHL